MTADRVLAHQHGALLPGVDEAIAANSQGQQGHGHSGLVTNKRGAFIKRTVSLKIIRRKACSLKCFALISPNDDMVAHRNTSYLTFVVP